MSTCAVSFDTGTLTGAVLPNAKLVFQSTDGPIRAVGARVAPADRHEVTANASGQGTITLAWGNWTVTMISSLGQQTAAFSVPQAASGRLEAMIGAPLTSVYSLIQLAVLAAGGRGLYETPAAGRAATVNGEIFLAPLSPSGVGIYRRDSAGSSPQIGSYFTGEVTATRTDTTAGRLLKVGDFGLGTVPPNIGGSMNDASQGFTRVQTTDTDKPLQGIVNVAGIALTNVWLDGSTATQVMFVHFPAGQEGRVFTRVRVGGVWGAWDRALMGADQTQTATDATAGRLLRVGDFGLGGQAIPPSAAISIDDSTLANGLYRFLGGVSGGVAPLGSEGTFLHVRRDAGVRAHQIWLSQATTAMYFRAWSGTAWTSWFQMVHSGNLLGTVSQSGGVPTGRVIERGSNANGEYVRFADGTQICTRRASASASIGLAFMGGFRSGSQGWTYPASFAAVPSVSVTAENLTAFGAVLAAVPTTTAASWAATAVTAQADTSACAVDLVAIGRWF